MEKNLKHFNAGSNAKFARNKSQTIKQNKPVFLASSLLKKMQERIEDLEDEIDILNIMHEKEITVNLDDLYS